MAALRYVDRPGYSALILRRRLSDLHLDGGLIQVSHSWLRGRSFARWSGTHKRWTFASGATLSFGYLEHTDDRFRYQSTQYQFIGFDELTEFGLDDYLWMNRSLRGPKSLDVRTQLCGATNPIGRGLKWVRDRFVINPAKGTLFIPASIDDNPGLDAAAYASNLEHLPQFEREALLEGNWFAEKQTFISAKWIDAATSDSLWPSPEPPRGTAPVLFVGVDFGRSRDRTVIWTWEKVGDVCWCRDLCVLHETPFDEQMRQIRKRLGRFVCKAAMDSGMMGAPLVEQLQAEFPGVVEGIGLNQPAQRRMAERLRVGFESGRVRVPDDPDLRDDLQLVSLGDDGNVVTKRDPSIGHGDRFWAAALAYEPACFNEAPKFRAPLLRAR